MSHIFTRIRMLPWFAMFKKVPVEITVPGNAGMERGGERDPIFFSYLIIFYMFFDSFLMGFQWF